MHKARLKVVLQGIAEKPAYRPGRKFMYSNVGYTIAAAMAEKATGSTWEDLVKREVFEPLKLTEAGFGPPKSANATLEQPRGHRKVFPGKVAVDDTADNTPIMGPSGNVHMTLANLCTFAGEHLHGELGTGKLLSPATYKRLHTPTFDHQACGWVRKDPSAEIPCTVYWHNGSNTYWYCAGGVRSGKEDGGGCRLERRRFGRCRSRRVGSCEEESCGRSHTPGCFAVSRFSEESLFSRAQLSVDPRERTPPGRRVLLSHRDDAEADVVVACSGSNRCQKAERGGPAVVGPVFCGASADTSPVAVLSRVARLPHDGGPSRIGNAEPISSLNKAKGLDDAGSRSAGSDSGMLC